MREDMFKVIVERPRRTRGKSTKTKLRYMRDDRSKITGRRLACELGDRKWLNENLAPLKRYLFKQRGRKWDDVFSEICEHLDTGSTVKMHVRQHLKDFVMINVRIDEDGQFWGCDGWEPKPPNRWWTDLYVCPMDGSLKELNALYKQLGLERPTRFRWTSKNPPESLKILSDTHYHVQKNGIWYDIKTDTKPTPGKNERYSYCGGYSYKELEAVLFEANPLRPGPGQTEVRNLRRWKILSKKQLSKKELKQHGLKTSYDDGGANV